MLCAMAVGCGGWGESFEIGHSVLSRFMQVGWVGKGSHCPMVLCSGLSLTFDEIDDRLHARCLHGRK